MTHNITQVLQTANDALYVMGGHSSNRFAIAAQMIQEKGWNWWDDPQPPYNVGNVTKGGVQNGFAEYPTLTEGMEGYARVYTTFSEDEGKTLVYQNVLDAAKIENNNEGLLHAICNSPFCDPPYPFDTLNSIMQTLIEMDHANHSIPIEVPQPASFDEYTVQPGDTLWSIAQKEYGNGNLWTEIMTLNPGTIPQRLQIGQKLRIK